MYKLLELVLNYQILEKFNEDNEMSGILNIGYVAFRIPVEEIFTHLKDIKITCSSIYRYLKRPHKGLAFLTNFKIAGNSGGDEDSLPDKRDFLSSPPS